MKNEEKQSAQSIQEIYGNRAENSVKYLCQKYMNAQEQFFLIPLNQIANWEAGTPGENGILAEVPILQRGLVWDQSQIELLWDSILRGIPIGSIVLCRITKSIEDQSRRRVKDTTHFIIDGQQRCNSITLGFSAFPPKEENSSIIWLDLNAKNLPGTREFLVRLTTLAHPWGFSKADDAGRLAAKTIREKLSVLNDKKENEIDFAAKRERYKPSEIYPFDADCPVPLSILLNADQENFWENVKAELRRFATTGFQWAKSALQFIDSENVEKEKIQRAIQHAICTEIIALNMPDFLMKPTSQEKMNENNVGITNIEHLFQRLNRQGTKLDGEELVYSMMKSHFPEIASKIDEVAEKRMPSSKLVQLSIRLVLSDDKGLKGPFNVSQIRKIVSAQDENEKKKIIDFINNELELVASTVDRWLTNGDKTWGIPAVLKTGIALSSPDVYCLLLHLAWKHPNLEEESYKRITGIALFIHWFVDDKGRAISTIYKRIYNANSQDVLLVLTKSLSDEADNSYIKGFLQRIQKPELIGKIIDFKEVNLKSWRWDSACKENYLSIFAEEKSKEEEINQEFENFIMPLLTKLKGNNRDLLLYAQRNYLRERFPDYDPARKDLWKNINRPWDFDHILPAAYIYNKKVFHSHIDVCKEFYGTNGNMRAWPYEDNRSDQAVNTSDKMKMERYWTDSFINPDEREGFSDQDVIDDAAKAYKFAISCKSRIIRIYEEWYYNFSINELQIRD